MRFTKVQCKNHALRRMVTNFNKLADKLSGKQVCDPVRPNKYVKPKALVSGKIFLLRMGIDRACSYRGKRLDNLPESIELLRGDILNAPKHV